MSAGDVYLDIAAARQQWNEDLKMLEKTRRLTNYLSAAQIYLKDNFLLREPLKVEHFKERLLGHWGTCPGLNFVYGHCNLIIRRYDLDMFLVIGPGHGAPAFLSNLLLEGSLEKIGLEEYTTDERGMAKLIKNFSWVDGFPSHVNSEMPGVIHEGGELGYALAVSFGAVMDNPDLIVTCVVGDGEAETGPTATSWHSYKYLDPKESGAVLPILHDNKFKIGSPTIFGSMSDQELTDLFTGYGYQIRFVKNMEDIDADMASSMDWAVQEIRRIQQAARSDNPIFKPKWPLIILQTPKGWTGIKELKGKQIEGSYRSHQIPVKEPAKDEENLRCVESWLKSYGIGELMEEGRVKKEVLDTFPAQHRKMGMNPKTNPSFQPLNLPNIQDFSVTPERDRMESITSVAAKYLCAVVERNPKRFRIFSPDELGSNKLDAVLKATTRNFQWDKETAAKGGRVIEVLSEHLCQGLGLV